MWIEIVLALLIGWAVGLLLFVFVEGGPDD